MHIISNSGSESCVKYSHKFEGLETQNILVIQDESEKQNISYFQETAVNDVEMYTDYCLIMILTLTVFHCKLNQSGQQLQNH